MPAALYPRRSRAGPGTVHSQAREPDLKSSAGFAGEGGRGSSRPPKLDAGPAPLATSTPGRSGCFQRRGGAGGPGPRVSALAQGIPGPPLS